MTASRQQQFGVFFGIAAYGLWGLMPLYFKEVKHVAPLEVLAHRALWSFVVLAVVVAWLRRWPELMRELGDRRLRWMLAATSILIAANWLTFIYAVVSGQVVQSSLGYFVTPLINVLLGVVFLRERLRPMQLASIALAAVGLAVLTVSVEEWPWIAAVLALTFSSYGLLRKLVRVDGLVSLTVETAVLAPVAIAYLAWLGIDNAMSAQDGETFGKLALAGVVTTVPLLFFGATTRRLRLATIGILQYLTPTISFLLAVFHFHEPFSLVQLVSFGFIWAAVALYTADSLRAHRAATTVIEEFGAE